MKRKLGRRISAIEAFRRVEDYLDSETQALAAANSKAHERLRQVTLADGEEMEATDWQEPPRNHDKLGKIFDPVDDPMDVLREIAKRSDALRAKSGKVSSQWNRKQRAAAAERRKRYQEEADRIWRKHPGWSRTRVAELVRTKIKGRPSAQSIARSIREKTCRA